MNTSTRARIAAAAVGLSLLVGVAGPAAAAVNSGGGQLGYTTTICQESIYHYHGFEATARVRQEFDNQWVAVQFWTYDARGWIAQGWSWTNNPGWSYDGVPFHQVFDGLQPVSGVAAWLYVQYAWYDSNGWRVGGELVKDYPTLAGTQSTYCII
jgi:hypothetical protein